MTCETCIFASLRKPVKTIKEKWEEDPRPVRSSVGFWKRILILQLIRMMKHIMKVMIIVTVVGMNELMRHENMLMKI